MSARLLGLGTACPPSTLSQDDALDAILRLAPRHEPRRRALRALFRRSGAERRHSATIRRCGVEPPFVPMDVDPLGPGTAARMSAFERAARPLAAEASNAALADARVEASAITHVVSVTCTGFVAPGFDIALIDDLGLRRDVERTQVGFMGCHGALNGLRVAKALVEAAPGRRVLLVAVEISSAHVSYDLDDGAIVSNSLFSDGAAAAILGGADGPARGVAAVQANGALVLPDTADLMSWRIGDHGFQMTLSPRVPSVVEAYLGGWLHEWLGSIGLAITDVDAFAIHPGGPRVLDAVGRALDLDDDRLLPSRELFRTHGNMSSPTVLFILERLLRHHRPRRVVALGFGPGLAIEAALLEVEPPP